VPRAYEDEGAYEGKKIIEGPYKGKKMRKKGPTKVKMKEIDPQNFFALLISKKCQGPTRALIRPC
jgi:hypothetical protein